MIQRRGFTIIELLMTLTIVGLLSSIAVPKFRDVRRRASAAQIMGDFTVLRHAALSFYADSQYYPEETGAGEIPPNLTKYLPQGFSMKRDQWELDYEHWDTKTASALTTSGNLIGVSFSTPDTALGRTAMVLMGNNPNFTMGTKYTFLLSSF
jgi:prepilin-type N-terminal cleavage/methylation domain-containing protein